MVSTAEFKRNHPEWFKGNKSTLHQLDSILKYLKDYHNNLSDLQFEFTSIKRSDGTNVGAISGRLDTQEYYASDEAISAFTWLSDVISIQNHELELCLTYLIEKGYVSKGETNQKEIGYRITIKGLMFKGFVKEKKDEDLKRNLRYVQIVVLAIFSALTASWALVQIFDRFSKCCGCHH